MLASAGVPRLARSIGASQAGSLQKVGSLISLQINPQTGTLKKDGSWNTNQIKPQKNPQKGHTQISNRVSAPKASEQGWAELLLLKYGARFIVLQGSLKDASSFPRWIPALPNCCCFPCTSDRHENSAQDSCVWLALKVGFLSEIEKETKNMPKVGVLSASWWFPGLVPKLCDHMLGLLFFFRFD